MNVTLLLLSKEIMRSDLEAKFQTWEIYACDFHVKQIERGGLEVDGGLSKGGRWFQNNLTNGQIWNNVSPYPDNQDLIRPAHCIMSWAGGLTD